MISLASFKKNKKINSQIPPTILFLLFSSSESNQQKYIQVIISVMQSILDYCRVKVTKPKILCFSFLCDIYIIYIN
uniref:Uncharacterized protein n=1 Tax=Lepeophtheirus salmonis TaxID=72036 RepID=A0A0K2UIU3_LEPSM